MKRFKVLWIVLGVIVGLVGITVLGVNYVFDSVLGEMTTTAPIAKEDAEVTEELMEREEETNIIHVALLGIDAKKTEQSTTSRSDAIKVLSLDPDNKRAAITSIQRDMVIWLPGEVQDFHKLNHAYWHGGPELTMQTLNYNYDLDVTRYVGINFDALKLIIDKLGGVQVSDRFLATGEEALAYLRNRSDSDYYRMDRQTETILAIFEVIKTLPYDQLLGLVTEILPYIETNLTKTEIIELGMEALKIDLNKIETFHVPSGDYSDTKTVSYNGFSPLYVIESYQDMVKEIHNTIYGIDDYEPSDRVKETEAAIYEKFGRVE